ncbi:hypothetical protein W594_00108 [Staphylococcus aureus VET0336R]|nr:hypothetical protein W594_00108 [Staphylococcus aureus VET0336R]
MWLFNLNKVGGRMFGFTKRHEQDWRLTRLEENDKTMFEKFDRIEDSLRAQEKIYDKLDRNFEELKRDKEEDEKNKEKNAKNIRDIKMWILGLIGTILSTFVIALLKTIFGI